MKLHLNLASKPFRNYTILYVFFGMLLAAVLFMIVANVWIYLSSHSKAVKLENSISNDIKTITEYEREIKDIDSTLKMIKFKELNEEVGFINTLLKERSFSWTLLFNELERLLPMSVQIRNIVPNVRENEITVKLTCSAKTPMDVIAFIQNLEDSGTFYEVFPTHEKDEFKEKLKTGIDFSLDMKYLPADRETGGEDFEQKSYLRKAY